jgi:hypothetical protein
MELKKMESFSKSFECGEIHIASNSNERAALTGNPVDQELELTKIDC